MTRQIKFRAWDKEVEQMIGVLKLDFLFESTEGICAEGYCDCNGGLTQNHENHKHNIFPENLELMQFTGLLDKNGKEIYESDIVQIPDDYEEYSWMAGEVREIYYRDGCFRFKPKREGFDRGHHIDEDNTMEIIGNIYSNPKLLSITIPQGE